VSHIFFIIFTLCALCILFLLILLPVVVSIVLFNRLVKPHLELPDMPSQKEIYDPNLIQLSKRLKGESIAETLNNILEWQENNINYWIERVADSKVITPLLIITIVSVVVVISVPTKYYLNIFVWLLICSVVGFLTSLITLIIRYKYLHLNLTSAVSILCLTLCDSIKVPEILKYKKAVCRDYARLTIALL